MFSSADWQTYTPHPGTDVILVLRFLVGGFPVIVLAIGFIGLYLYPIHGNRLEENRKKLDELHAKKRSN